MQCAEEIHFPSFQIVIVGWANRSIASSEAKVDQLYFDCICEVEEYVPWFDIAVHNSQLVDVL
jgi:hypothetical protein